MYLTLVTIIIALFIAMLFLNIYFRVNVFKQYKYLEQNKIEFGVNHIFDKKKMQQEILPKYPEHKEDILKFVNEMRFSLQIASIFIVLIFIAAFILRS